MTNDIIQANIFDGLPSIEKEKQTINSLLEYDAFHQYVPLVMSSSFQTIKWTLLSLLGFSKREAINQINAERNTLDFLDAKGSIIVEYKQYLASMNQSLDDMKKNYDLKIKDAMKKNGKAIKQSVVAHLTNLRDECESFWNNFSSQLFPNGQHWNLWIVIMI